MESLYRIFNSTDKEWLQSLLKGDDPEEVSHAARRLYELGEKELALNTLLGQVRQFKNIALHKFKRDATVFSAIRSFWFVRDERAIPDLIEALDVYTLQAASALGRINGDKLRKTLHELSKSDGRRALGAILALGYMKDKEILPTIIAIVKDMKSYEKKYLGIEFTFDSNYVYQFMAILGEYDSLEAKGLFSELRSRVMLWGYEIMESTDKEWLTKLLKSETPIHVRSAAIRLYQLGEQDLGLKTIIDQMNQYKDPNTPKGVLAETCPGAIVDLGIIGDELAIPDLIEALDVYPIISAYALSLINGDRLKSTLIELSHSSDVRGFGSILALGYMGDLRVLHAVMDITSNISVYLERYLPNLISEAGIQYFSIVILSILGTYEHPDAEQLFFEKISKNAIRSFIMNYAALSEMRHTRVYEEIKKLKPDIKISRPLKESHGLSGAHLIKKFGWNKYLDKPEVLKMLTDNNLQKWDKEINALVDLIWDDVQKKQKEK